MDEHFLQARAVLNAEDPLGLLAMGAPEDEYDDEVQDFLSRSTPVTQARVREVFIKWFGEESGRLDGPVVERLTTGLEAARKAARKRR